MLLQSTKCVFKRCRLQGSTSESPFPASAPSSLCIPFMTKKRHPHPAAGTAFWEPAPPTPNGARALLLPLPQHLRMCTPLCMPQPLPSSGLPTPSRTAQVILAREICHCKVPPPQVSPEHPLLLLQAWLKSHHLREHPSTATPPGGGSPSRPSASMSHFPHRKCQHTSALLGWLVCCFAIFILCLSRPTRL